MELRAKMPIDMNDFLGRFSNVMEDSKTLLTSMEFDYCIPLKEEAKPINVTHYQYAYYQKTEIKKQVNKILVNGLIRPSTSSFSSLVLLVKKNDGTLKFYTNYRALNETTIKDMFSILTIDELRG